MDLVNAVNVKPFVRSYHRFELDVASTASRVSGNTSQKIRLMKAFVILTSTFLPTLKTYYIDEMMKYAK